MSEPFPHIDKTGSTMTINGTEIVAFDLDRGRYCVDCAKEMDSIDCERFHKQPRSVPYGDSVRREHMHNIDHDYHCDNHDCGRKIPQ